MLEELTPRGSSVLLLCSLCVVSFTGAACISKGDTVNTAETTNSVAAPSPEQAKPETPAGDAADVNAGGQPPAAGSNPTPQGQTAAAELTPTPGPNIRQIVPAPSDQVAAIENFKRSMSAASQRRGELEAVHMSVVYTTTNTQVGHTDTRLLEVRFRGKFDLENANVYIHAAPPAELYLGVTDGGVIMYRPKINEVLRIRTDSALDQSSQLKEFLKEAQKLGVLGGNVLPRDKDPGTPETKEQKVLGTYLVGVKRTTLIEEVRKKGKHIVEAKVWMDLEKG